MGIELYSNAPMPEEPAQLEPCWCAKRRPTPAGEAAATAFYLDGAPLDDAAQAALRESAARYQARTDAPARPCATCGGAGCRVRPARPGLHCGPTAKPMLRALRTLPCDGGGHGEAEPARLLALLEAGPAARDGFLDPARAFVRDAIARGATLVYWA